MKMIHICSPHLGDSWKTIQKEYIKKYSKEYKYNYQIYFVSDNVKHLRSIGRCLVIINKMARKGDLVILMDSDAFPVSEKWLYNAWKYLERGNEFFAVQRLENPNGYRDIPHPCYCGWIHGTPIRFKEICGNPYIENYKNRSWKKLHRVNDFDVHRQMYGLYGIEDKIPMIFHAGAGSRIDVVKEHGFFKEGVKYYDEFWKDPELFMSKLMR